MKKYYKKLVLLSITILIFCFAILPKSFAADELSVTAQTRISHPAFQSSQVFYTVRNPWNLDYTKMMLSENTDPYDFPSPYGEQGRQFIWGYVSELKNWGSSAISAAGPSGP